MGGLVWLLAGAVLGFWFIPLALGLVGAGRQQTGEAG